VSPAPLLPLHISLSDWDGVLVLVLGFGPFLLVVALIVFLRTRDFDEESEGQGDA
jgi:hypothetical protein